MKKVITFIPVLIFLCISTGCESVMPQKIDINELFISSTFAIDKSDENVLVTVSSKKVKPKGNGDSEGSQSFMAEYANSQGATIFEAVRRLHSLSLRRMFHGHAEYIIIGEETAKSDILKYLDFFERDHEMRLNNVVVIVKGARAEDVIYKAHTNEEFVADRLNSLFNNRDSMSISDKVDLVDLMGMFDNKQMAAYIPCISLVKESKKGLEADREEYNILLDGFAVFKGDKLVGYATDTTARGANWIRGKVKSGIIVVKDNDGEKISFEIIDSGVDVIPKFNDGELSVLIKVKMSSNIGEIQGREDIYNEKTFKYLENQQNMIIKSEIEDAISFAKQNNADFIEICDSVYHKYPVKWDKIKDDWDNIFPKLKIDVLVESRINRTYDIKQPTRYKAGE